MAIRHFSAIIAAAGAAITVSTAGALEGAQEEVVKSTIAAMLRDPDSAKFSSISSAQQSDGDVIVCGAVNAKNGFGGYVGATPFVGKLHPSGEFTLTKMASESWEFENIESLCRSYGASIKP